MMFSALSQLYRAPVSAMVAVSSGFGFLLAEPMPEARLLVVMAGMFSLTAFCSAVNQIQEIEVDATLTRTSKRPLPSGSFSVFQATLAALAALLAAAICLLYLRSWLLLAGSCIVVALYNGVYTPMKKHSGFALLVGAIPGAMPPVMGWIAAGGTPGHVAIITVFVVYYLWQVPHFWLRVEQDLAEYKSANLPLPRLSLGKKRYHRLLRVWFHAYAASLLVLPLFSTMHNPLFRMSIAALAIALFCTTGLLFSNQQRAFHGINICMFAVMILLVSDTLAVVQG